MKKGRNRRDIWSKNGWDFSKINDRHQNTNSGSSEKSKQDKFFFNLHVCYIQTTENKTQKSWKKPVGKASYP